MSEHGKHNKTVCDKLHAEPGFEDWVVTTAFYSALHFVQSKIFPIDHNGEKIKSLEGAHNNTDLKRVTKHATMTNLVGMKLPSLYTNYKYLQTTCHTARYSNYKIGKQAADNSRFYLDGIIAECAK